MSFKSMALAAAVMLTTVSSLGAAGARRAAAVRAACRGGPRSTLTAGHGTRSPFALAGHQAGPRSARAFEYVPVSALDRGHRAADLLRYQVGQRAQIENEVRGSRNHQRLPRWTGHVPKLVMLADVSLLLYFIGAITDVNWASPLPVNPAFAMLLAAMAITLSYGFLAFAHYRLHGYKDHPGNEVRGSRNHQRLPRWTGHVPKLVMLADVSLLLYFIGAITDVNWASPLPVNPAFAMLLAAMAITLSYGFLAFAHYRLHGYKDHPGNEVRGSRNHQRLPRWTGHVPKLVMLADVSLLLYFIGAITDVNWASPLPVNPAFAMLLAAMAITLSYGFLAFAHYRLHGYKDHPGNEVRGSRNHQRLPRWTGHVPKLVMLADVSLLLYFIGAITDVNWASPLPVNPAFAMLLAAMAITLSYGFLAFAHYRLHGYKDHPGTATPVALARAYVISCARSLALESVPGLLSARTGRRRDPRSTATAGRCASWLSVLAVGCADPRSSQTVPRRVPSCTGHRTVQPGWTG